MKKVRRWTVWIIMGLAFAYFFVWGCATTPPPTTPYNPVFNCSFKEAWDGVLISLDESGVHLSIVDRESGWAKGWFTEWDQGMYATYYISVTINEIRANEWRILVDGSFTVTTPIATPKARGYLRRRVLRIQEAITQNMNRRTR